MFDPPRRKGILGSWLEGEEHEVDPRSRVPRLQGVKRYLDKREIIIIIIILIIIIIIGK